MVNARRIGCIAALLLAAAVLTAAAALRSAEYDEQYTLFLTGGVARPIWPQTPFTAGRVQAMQSGHAGLADIARDLRRTDVHPPLYFWAVALWRRALGGGVFRARMFSVLCSLVALVAAADLACSAGIPPTLATVLTLGCYGFAYTGSVARGFALAQALSLGGAALLMRRRHFAGGLALGAATAANYLAAFVALVHLAHAAWPDRTPDRREARRSAGSPLPTASCPSTSLRAAIAVQAKLLVGFAAFLPLDLEFFLAQRQSRPDQFPALPVFDSLHRLAHYLAANFVGGLPLYVPGAARPAVAAALSLSLCALAALMILRRRHIRAVRLLAASVVAPPFGLLALGAIFHTAPIELRYLAFATPFAAILLAGALAALPPGVRRPGIALVLAVQAAAVAGLLIRPETMQPARATAAAAASLAQDGVVLLPRGNDGVGIVGAFAGESPPDERLVVVDPGETASRILARAGPARRVVLAFLAQDDASRATVPLLRAAFDSACWRRIAEGFNVDAYDFICAHGGTSP